VDVLRRASEGLARKTTRRRLFGRGADAAFPPTAGAGGLLTVCIFPGPPCPCEGCTEAGVCGKPCIIQSRFYASGCWVTDTVTCCDCDCNGKLSYPGGTPSESCGCGSDYHNDPAHCP